MAMPRTCMFLVALIAPPAVLLRPRAAAPLTLGPVPPPAMELFCFRRTPLGGVPHNMCRTPPPADAAALARILSGPASPPAVHCRAPGWALALAGHDTLYLDN